MENPSFFFFKIQTFWKNEENKRKGWPKKVVSEENIEFAEKWKKQSLTWMDESTIQDIWESVKEITTPHRNEWICCEIERRGAWKVKDKFEGMLRVKQGYREADKTVLLVSLSMTLFFS